MRFYLDSNVFLSYVFKEFGNIEDFMEEATTNFFAICSEDKHTLIISDFMIEETKPKCYYSEKEVFDLFKKMNIQTQKIKEEKQDYNSAEKISNEFGIHLEDARHVQLAIKTKSDAIITWNERDFKKTKKIMPLLLPKEFR